MKLSFAAVAAALSATATPTVATPGWNFLVMGDWGGSQEFPFTTPEELQTAHGMGVVGASEESQYCLALGDNFYHTGVSGLDDTRFNTTFENVFTNDALKRVDYFRVVLGNHDHLGNASAQIAYSQVSPRWRMDDYYWSFSETTHDGFTIDTIFIDTVTWAGT